MLEWLRYNDVPHTVVATKPTVKSAKRQRRKRDWPRDMLEQGDIVWVGVKNVGIERLRDPSSPPDNPECLGGENGRHR